MCSESVPVKGGFHQNVMMSYYETWIPRIMDLLSFSQNHQYIGKEKNQRLHELSKIRFLGREIGIENLETFDFLLKTHLLYSI